MARIVLLSLLDRHPKTKVGCHKLRRTGTHIRRRTQGLSSILHLVYTTEAAFCSIAQRSIAKFTRSLVKQYSTNDLQGLLCTPVNFFQERREHLPPDDNASDGAGGSFMDGCNERRNLRICRLLVLCIPLPHPELLIHRLNLRLLLRVLSSVIFVEDLALRGRGVRKSDVDAPLALVIDDVRADLPDLLWGATIVEKVVLDLEVFPERDEDRECDFVWFDEERVVTSLMVGGGERV